MTNQAYYYSSRELALARCRELQAAGQEVYVRKQGNLYMICKNRRTKVDECNTGNNRPLARR